LGDLLNCKINIRGLAKPMIQKEKQQKNIEKMATDTRNVQPGPDLKTGGEFQLDKKKVRP